MLPSHDELQDQLVRLIDARLLDPLEILLDDDEVISGVRAAVGSRASTLARELVDADDATAVGTIMRVVATLYPGDHAFDPPIDWWRSPLGQVVARRVGHPTAERISYPVAGAMLAITRQGVHDLVTRGKLIRHPQGGVTPASVRDRLSEKGNTAHA